MTWQHYATLIETAAATTLAADSFVGTAGSLSVATRESEPPQESDEAPQLIDAQIPYIGIRCTTGDAELIGTGGTLRIDCTLRMRIVTRKSPSATAYADNLKIRDAAAFAIRAKNFVSGWVVSGTQAEISGWTCTEPEPDDDDPYLFESLATLSIGVFHCD